MAFHITCPNCGSRPYTEFAFGGELVPLRDEADDADTDYARVWLRRNDAGRRPERWFHQAGCRRWLTIERDTVTNEIG